MKMFGMLTASSQQHPITVSGTFDVSTRSDVYRKLLEKLDNIPAYSGGRVAGEAIVVGFFYCEPETLW